MNVNNTLTITRKKSSTQPLIQISVILGFSEYCLAAEDKLHKVIICGEDIRLSNKIQEYEFAIIPYQSFDIRNSF